jgi:hypothetical protein
MERYFCSLKKKMFFLVTLNHDIIRAKFWGDVFSRWNQTKDFWSLRTPKHVAETVCISKGSFGGTDHFSFSSSFLPITPVPMFTPKPFQIHTHSCRLTASSCSETPLPFWLRIPSSRDSGTVQLNEASEKAASSPNFPWIRSWHFSEGKDNVWNPASPGSRPSPCHRTSTSYT